VTLSILQITAQLEAVLGKRPDVEVVAIRADARGVWPDTVTTKGRHFALRWCESSLAVRESLDEQRESATDKMQGLVVLTPLKLAELGEDVAARLAGHRIFQPEGWGIAQQLFCAREADARLATYGWMPQLLLDYASDGEYPSVANGFLDMESVWREILQRALEISEPKPDVMALLRWSMQPSTSFAYQQFPQVARAHLAEWLVAGAGPAGRLVLSCVEFGNALEALPLGLVCDIVFSREAPASADLGNAAIRLERYVNNQHISLDEGQAWADAATRVAVQIGVADLLPFLDRVDEILKDLRIETFAEFSHVLPSGFEARLRGYAQHLIKFIAQPSASALEKLEQCASYIEQHALAKSQSGRFERVQMATRLARWLVSDTSVGADFESLARWHAASTAFVDWARFRLRGGDELQEVSLAYTALRDAIRTKSEHTNQGFARALVDWNRNAVPSSGGCIPLEHALSEIVAPLAAHAPVLLLVADGLSCSIFRELFCNPAEQGWLEWIADKESAPFVGIAALPTITEISRTSLLSGRLIAGAAHNEKQAFSNHPALLQHSRTNAPPVLFHKGDLAEATTLSQTVRDAVASPRRVVGVVYNAIDDHLDGSDQVNHHWTINALRLLAPLLREARQARRILVVTADHGHVLEDGTSQRGNGEGDRWRSTSGAVGEQEMIFEGGRVLTPQGDNGVICVWSESVRHGSKKNGYHGGVSAQEVVVPMSVFAPVGVDIPDWHLAPPVVPEWWSVSVEPVEATTVPVAPFTKTTARRSQVPSAQATLFEHVEPAPAITDAVDWITRLLTSQTYESQKRLAARVAPDDVHIRTLLESLQSRGGKLVKAVVAQRLGIPELRVSGFVMAARRVLNVDQQSVLSLDESTGVVELNKDLLIRQFRIDG